MQKKTKYGKFFFYDSATFDNSNISIIWYVHFLPPKYLLFCVLFLNEHANRYKKEEKYEDCEFYSRRLFRKLLINTMLNFFTPFFKKELTYLNLQMYNNIEQWEIYGLPCPIIMISDHAAHFLFLFFNRFRFYHTQTFINFLLKLLTYLNL